MKFRLIVKLAEIVLGEAFSEKEHRADMYLPMQLFAMSIVLLIVAVAAMIFAAVKSSVVLVVISVICWIIAFLALLCWRNQKIVVLSEEEFEYTTFLGNKKVYRFSDIKALRKNNDSLTLFVANDKVHMEAMAVISERLASLIDAQLKNLYGE